MKADTNEPLHYTDSQENIFYNLKNLPMIINICTCTLRHVLWLLSFPRQRHSELGAYYISPSTFWQKTVIIFAHSDRSSRSNEAPLDLLLGFLLNLMIPEIIQSVLWTESLSHFAVTRMTSFEVPCPDFSDDMMGVNSCAQYHQILYAEHTFVVHLSHNKAVKERNHSSSYTYFYSLLKNFSFATILLFPWERKPLGCSILFGSCPHF